MKRFNRETIISFILIFVFGYAYYEANQLGEMSGVFPKTISFITLILCVGYFIKSFWTDVKDRPFENIDRKKVATMIAGMVMYAVGLWLVGFLFTSLLIVTLLVFVLQEKGTRRTKWMKASTSSILICGGFYCLFRFVFLVPLPNGEVLYYLFGI